MADKDEELELDVNPPKANKMTTILLIVLIVLVLIIGAVGAWLYFSKDSGSESESGGEASDGDAKTEKVLKPLVYLSLVPEFVVNFGPGSKVRYLQVDLQISTRDEDVLPIINTYRPVLRNDILVLLSGQTYDELRQRGGKEALQKNILNTVNRVVVEAIHSEKNKEEKESNNEKAEDKQQTEAADVKGPIENVYFTSFIMQ